MTSARRASASGALMLFACMGGSASAQQTTPLPPVRVEVSVPRREFRTWPDSMRRLMRDSLAAGRVRWERSRPKEYVVAVRTILAMMFVVDDRIPEGHIPVTRVRGTRIAGTTMRLTPGYSTRGWESTTIDSIFGELERVLANPERRLDRLTLDPEYGFPRSWVTELASNGYNGSFRTEQAHGAQVAFFSADPHEWRCTWWARVRRACRRWTRPALDEHD